MPHEDPHSFENYDSLEQKKECLIKKADELRAVIEGCSDIIARMEQADKDDTELSAIITGLFEKAQQLTREDNETLSQKLPETDEEFDAWIDRYERIQSIYTKITELELEAESVKGKIADLQIEFDVIMDVAENKIE